MSTKFNSLKKRLESVQTPTNNINQTLIHLFLFALSMVFIVPILIFIMNSLKGGSTGVFVRSYSLPEKITFKYYILAFTEGGFHQYIANSAVVVVSSVLLILVCSSLAAYALVRFDFKGQNWVMALILAGFMIPTQILFIPRYVMISWMDLLNTHLSLVLVYVASAIPFSVFVLRQYFIQIPSSLAEAARLDGCSEYQIFYRIYLPLAIPAITTVVVFQFIFLWNEFLYAISFVSNEGMRTLPAALFQYKGPFGTNWPRLMAAVTISVVPTILLFLVFRNQFIQGINMRAKG